MPNTIIQPNDAKCWIIDDQRPGHVNQSLALATGLGIGRDCVLLDQCDAARLSLQCSNRRRMLMGCGRRAAQQIVEITRRRPGAWSSVQILDPLRDRSAFDWLLVPDHDNLSGSQVLTFCGALTAVDDQWLTLSKENSSGLGELPEPRLGVLLGGPIRHCRWSEKTLQRWLEQAVASCKASNGSLLVASSRRTPGWVMKQLRELTGVRHQIVDWRDQDNHYPGILAWSNQLWVSADSISMLAEACATRASVRVLGAAIAGGRQRQYLDSLTSRGRLVDADQAVPVWPIRETARLAATLLNRGALLGLGNVVRVD